MQSMPLRNTVVFAKRGRLRFSSHVPIVRRGFANTTVDGKPYYITTPIFYPSAAVNPEPEHYALRIVPKLSVCSRMRTPNVVSYAPHIGHLHSIVVADIFARYARLARPGRAVYFMTGTDEHGLKIQKAAKEKGMEPLAFCDEVSQHFRNLTAKANISNTRFSRTTERDHISAVQMLWRGLNSRGLIYKGSHEGWYSISDECFYTDKQVSRVEQPSGTEDRYISTETGSSVEWTQEENYKFRLSHCRESLLKHYTAHPDAIFPAQFHADIIAQLAAAPLDDISVSRPSERLSWGIPVPDDAEHTIYVWIDALTVYLSACGFPWVGGSGTSAGWPPNIQVIGKDILRFHAIYLPAMLQAIGLPLTHQLLTHSHWTVDQRKMSKSVGNVADPIQAIDEFGIDIVRFYLARVGGRFKNDVDWSHSQLEKHAREVTSSLGNLYLRITSSKIQQRIQLTKLSPGELLNSIDKKSSAYALLRKLTTLSTEVQILMNHLLVADAVDYIVLMLGQANQLMTESAPWAASTSTDTVEAVYTTILETLRICGILLQPFMPSKAEMLLDALGTHPEQRTIMHSLLGQGKIGHVQSGVRLFDIPKREKL